MECKLKYSNITVSTSRSIKSMLDKLLAGENKRINVIYNAVHQFQMNFNYLAYGIENL